MTGLQMKMILPRNVCSVLTLNFMRIRKGARKTEPRYD